MYSVKMCLCLSHLLISLIKCCTVNSLSGQDKQDFGGERGRGRRN